MAAAPPSPEVDEESADADWPVVELVFALHPTLAAKNAIAAPRCRNERGMDV